MSQKVFVVNNRNHRAVLRTREDKTGKLRTETHGRDEDSVNFAVTTDPGNNRTRLFIDFPSFDGTVVRLSGVEARTLYNLLRKHYEATDKAV